MTITKRPGLPRLVRRPPALAAWSVLAAALYTAAVSSLAVAVELSVMRRRDRSDPTA